MKIYSTDIHGVKLLSDIVAHLDHVKNLLPTDSMAYGESYALIDHGHDLIERMLGDDTALIYGPADTALAQPSGAGGGAMARSPQTGDCVANESARPADEEPEA